jgi:hypothetical protein
MKSHNIFRTAGIGLVIVCTTVAVILSFAAGIAFTARNIALGFAAIALAVYVIIYLSRNAIMRHVEEGPDDLSTEHIQLKLSNAQMHIAYFGGIGLSLLIPELVNESHNFWLTSSGLALLTAANLFFYGEYYPWYEILNRRYFIQEQIKSKQK